MRQVTFTRALVPGAPGDLVIDSDPIGADFWLPEDGFEEPEFDQRSTFADPSIHIAGGLLTQSVTDVGTFAALIYTQAATGAELKANKRMLEVTVRQWRYTLALTIVGDPDSYAAMPGKISWGELDSGMTKALMARAVVTIPVQPLEV